MRNTDGLNWLINARTCRRDPATRIGDAIRHAFGRIHNRLSLDSSSASRDNDCSGRDSFSKDSGVNLCLLECLGSDGSFHNRRSYHVRLDVHR